ncbi:stage II sporulation protein R [Bacillus salipaludis]|uniref:Stage II sporulation protein R n=1 Tax=Bacillus salipaludis TaxID=2547811 RepID=A0A4R5VXE3_9BACI|nr:stage II sporulation protein R [Bacillus salipaludis]MDQ6595184.1 stage II sporulation protein R [Bacillus salipaludis]TDK63962.1 stage II sporulation protein R [Bacillus salipaludis]
MHSKTLIWAYLLILSFGTILSLYIPKNEAIAKESVVIPGEAIRLRILANSDVPADQQLKREVRDAVNAKITVWVKDLTSINKARSVIKSKLPEIQDIAEKTVAAKGSKQAVHVEFGKVQFPTKLYGEFLYPAGEYQAILITLGEGKGANWWCVLYPPLCFLDFSNGVAVSDGFDEKVKSESEVQRDSEKTSEKVEDQGEEQKAVAAGSDEEQESTDSERRFVTSTSKVEKKHVETDSKVEQNPVTRTSEVEEKSTTTTNNTEENPTAVTSDVKEKSAPATSGVEQKAETTDKNTVEKSVDVSKSEQTAQAPVYTSKDEDPVQVKFFVVELWKKLFD